MKRLLFFLLLAGVTRAADFGDIPANLTLGAGTSVRRNAGNTAFEAYTPGTGGSSVWGAITGTLSDQTDLQTALDGKQPIDLDLTAIAALTTTSFGRGFLALADAAASRTYIGAGTGSGTVTSVGLAGTSNQITVTGTSPITSSGSFTLSIPIAAQLNVAKLTNLTTNGYVKTGSADGTLSIDANTYLTSAAIQDGAFANIWNGVTANAPSKNAVYDYLHSFIPNDDSKVNLLNLSTAALVATDTSGIVGSVLLGTGLSYSGGTGTLSLDADLVTIAGLTPGTSGNVIKSNGTNWTSAADVAPGGSNTQVQFNDSGAFGGDADFTWDKTNNVLTVATQYRVSAAWGGYAFNSAATDTIANYAGTSGAIAIFLGSQAIGYWSAASTAFDLGSNYLFAWGNGANAATSTIDTALGRNAAGVVEINNGTLGSYRDLICRNITISGGNFSGRINPRATGSCEETSSATSTPLSDSCDQWDVTALAVADAFVAPSGTPVNGQRLTIRIKDAGAAKALSFATGSSGQYRFSSDLAAPSTTVLSKTLYMLFIYNAADSRWDNVAQLNNF